MPNKCDLLILGADSDIGQSIIRLINDRFPFIECAVPAKRYRSDAILPPNQIVMPFLNQTPKLEDLKLFDVVLSCSPKYSSNKIKSLCEKCNTKFVDGCCSYPEAVIEAAFLRLPFQPTNMEAFQTASGFSIIDFWTISHQETSLPFPKKIDSKWCIEQESISLTEGCSVSHRLEFGNRFGPFFALLFWFLSLFSRLLFPYFKKGIPYRSISSWTFTGKTYEYNKKYKFRHLQKGLMLIFCDLILQWSK